MKSDCFFLQGHAMMRTMRFSFLLPVLLGVAILAQAAEENYPVHEDSQVHEGVPKGEMIKGNFTAKDNSVFPGTEREYQLYIPAGLDKTKPTPFMVFQDGIIYNAPVVFDNLIAKKEIPAMIGIFIKPGVVPAANPEALPRFNRSYEYDSVTDTYSRFLIDEFLPAITQKHGITLSTDPNDAGISGNSSGGICAFMVAWHRSDRFRRVFTGVGTYVGIHGADQLPVLVRKMEPKPIKVYLQTGENDNNLYCGDWWMANQMMERSLTWAGYDVAHTWGTGGHNGKQATAIFPDVMRWLWKGYPEAKEIKANPDGKSKWLGYQVLKEGSEWKVVDLNILELRNEYTVSLAPASSGAVYVSSLHGDIVNVASGIDAVKVASLPNNIFHSMTVEADGSLLAGGRLCSQENYDPDSESNNFLVRVSKDGHFKELARANSISNIVLRNDGVGIVLCNRKFFCIRNGTLAAEPMYPLAASALRLANMTLSPDQSQLYATFFENNDVVSIQILSDGKMVNPQNFSKLESNYNSNNNEGVEANGLCVDSEGRLYVATALGIQVCDQAGRVNFIIPTPQKPYDVCFGGKDLSELFVACGDKIYKRQTKVHGVVSGQQPPIKPAPPKL
ncbi:SMP-30/gluconolactonase/LRE family protein [soil metagenome]